MKFAYADPPYLGQGRHYKQHSEAKMWNDPTTHEDLILRLGAEYPDGWALSASSPSLRILKPERFCRWVLDLLGWQPGDIVDDLFPGTGVFGRVLLAATASPEVLR